MSRGTASNTLLSLSNTTPPIVLGLRVLIVSKDLTISDLYNSTHFCIWEYTRNTDIKNFRVMETENVKRE